MSPSTSIYVTAATSMIAGAAPSPGERRGRLFRAGALRESVAVRLVAAVLLWTAEYLLLRARIDSSSEDSSNVWARLHLIGFLGARGLSQGFLDVGELVLCTLFVYWALGSDQLRSLVCRPPLIRVSFLVVHGVILGLFTATNLLLLHEPELARAHRVATQVIWHLLLAAWPLSSLLIFLRFDDAREVWRRLGRALWLAPIVSLSISFGLALLENAMVRLWPYVSEQTARTSALLLGTVFKDVKLLDLPGRGPVVTVGDFAVELTEECSGARGVAIYGMLVALLLLALWHRIDRAKAILVFSIGVPLCIAVNLLRISIVAAVGARVDPGLAAGIVHRNLGWLLYSLYFVLFAISTQRWWMRDSAVRPRHEVP